MIKARKSEDRGHFDHGWLDTRHTFSFGGYQDPEHMGFRALRVMNEDRVQPGAGFGEHGHSDMEIISYVLDGGLEHRDSLGNGSVLSAGMFQRMSAGTGVRHSEFNHSHADPLHFYQIWILPERNGIEPGYEERAFAADEAKNQFRLVVSKNGRDDSLRVHQDVQLHLARPERGTELEFPIQSGRHVWLQTIRGAVTLNGLKLSAGDGAALSEESAARIRAEENGEFILFDLA